MARSFMDILKGLWMTMVKHGDEYSVNDRIAQARLTTTKLKCVTGQYPKVEAPVMVRNIDPADERKITGELPAFEEFKEVLGLDPVVPQTATGTHRVSHVSQYRLTAFVANLPESARRAALGTTGTHTLPSA